MEECEEVMRWMSKCSKHEWRPKGGGGESVGFCADSGCPVGSRSAGGLFFWSPYPAEYIRRKN